MIRSICGLPALLLTLLCSAGPILAGPPEPWTPAAQPTLGAEMAAAAPLTLTDVLPGPESVWLIGPMNIANPGGESWDMVLFFSPEYFGPHEVVAIDFGTGTYHKQLITEIGGERLIFHLIPVINTRGKLYMLPRSSSAKLGVCTYDPATNKLRHHGYPMGENLHPPGGESMPPWQLGDDGMIYGPASLGRRVVAYRLDPDTFESVVSEPFGPEQDRTWLYAGSLVDGDWIYFKVGREPWQLFGYNYKTKTGKLLAQTERIIGDHTTIRLTPLEQPGGCQVAVATLEGRPDRVSEFWLRDGQLTEKQGDVPPWSDRPLQQWRRPKPDSSAWPEVLIQRPDPAGMARVWYRPKTAEQSQPAEKAPSADSAPSEATGWRKIEFAVNRYPQTIRRLSTLPDGRIFATTEGYGQAVLLDPSKGTRQPLGDTMSIYSQAETGGLIYMCGYPGSQLWSYDVEKPWTFRSSERSTADHFSRSEVEVPGDEQVNPRKLVLLSSVTQDHMHMPLGGVFEGNDGRIYCGGKIIRTGNGGGLGWWDPKTETAGGWRKPLSAYPVYWMGSTDGGRYIVCSTKAVPDDDNPSFTPEKGRLFIFDAIGHELVHQTETPPQINHPGPLVEAFPGYMIGYGTASEGTAAEGSAGESKGGVLYGLDAAAGKILWTKPMPAAPPLSFAEVRRARSVLMRGPDDHLWCFADKVLLRIRPSDATVQVVGKLTQGDEGQLAFSRGQLYVAGAKSLRRIELPEP